MTRPSDLDPTPQPATIRRHIRDVKDMSDAERAVLRRTVLASALGNFVEWFDYSIYGFLTVYVSAAFFPTADAGLGVVYTLAILAISFLVRPIGGLVLGPLGDRFGRRPVMVVTVAVMAVATAAIGVLPTHASVGAFAPLLLLLCRLVQGFSTGGEYGSTAVFMSEYAPDNQRGFYSSFLDLATYAGTAVGATLVSVAIVTVGDSAMHAGGWRVPFLLTLPLGLIVLYMRLRLQDSPVFEELRANKTNNATPIRRVLPYWRRLLMVLGYVVMVNVAYYMLAALMPSYLVSSLGRGVVQSNFTLVAIMVFMMVLITPFAALSDRIGRKPIMLAGCIGFALFSVPLFLLISRTESIALQVAALAGIALFKVIPGSINASHLPALFPSPVRVTGFAMSYNISTAIFGGTAPAVITLLVNKTGSPLVPGWYLTVAGAIAIVAVVLMPETAGRSVRGTTLPGHDDAERVAAGERVIGYKAL